MAQLSFFSAEANEPRVGDLAGVLCGQGQLVSFGKTAARLSVVLEARWRAEAIADACGQRGVLVELADSDEGHPLVRTAFRADLIKLATAWTKGAVKAVPPGLTLTGSMLRLWAMAAGDLVDDGRFGSYVLWLDPRAPDTHEPLAGALARCGLAPARPASRGSRPGLRISGRRRLARLAELVGSPPVPAAEQHWPAEGRVRATT